MKRLDIQAGSRPVIASVGILEMVALERGAAIDSRA
jgi:hypothetical protein